MTGWRTEVAAGPDATRVAGRYRLVDRLGAGSGGTVYRALDELTDQPVALKALTSGRRVQREIDALRLLALPGVVRILDDGQEHGAAWVVMALVEGRPFPGGERRSWEALEGVVLALLETLGRVHAAGVVHRDLKPANVLVRDDGTVVLLDFGVARGAALGDRITAVGDVVGTPRYLAPEQALGGDCDARADLYAVGVMVYEALTGRLPHDGDGPDALLAARLTHPAVPVGRWEPVAPAAVQGVIDRLLARDPADRPGSAGEVLAALGDGVGDGAAEAPWLGSRAPVDALLAAAAAGVSMDLVASPGAGGTRCLQEVAAALVAQGVDVRWTVPGQAAYASLAPLLHPLPDPRTSPLMVAVQLADRLAAGGVCLVDDPERVDAASREALARCQGTVLRLQRRPGARPHVVLASLDPATLRGLFHGPDRLLHLREDGAAELHRRTGGRPREVFAELRAWERAGLARHEAGRYRVDRAGLDQLRSGRQLRIASDAGPGALGDLEPTLRQTAAWAQLLGPGATTAQLADAVGRPAWEVGLELDALEEAGVVQRQPDGDGVRVDGARNLSAAWPAEVRRAAYATAATLLPPGAPGRLRHLLAGGVLDGLVEEAATTARRLRAEGRVGEAEAVLLEAMRQLRRAGRPSAALLPPLLRVACASDSVLALRRARFEVERSGGGEEVLGLAEASVLARTGGGRGAGDRLAALAPFEDAELEYVRRVMRFEATYLGMEGGEEALADLRSWADSLGDGEVAARVPGWEGLLRYRQGRFAEAAALHEESAARRTEPLGRLSALLNAAEAWVEAGRLGDARVAAQLALDRARALRATWNEARAEWLVRTVVLLGGEPAHVDTELLDAVDALGRPLMEGLVACTEARISLQRAGGRGLGRICARADRLGEALGPAHPSVQYLRALAIHGGVEPASGAEDLARWAAGCPVPGLGLEILGMLALRGGLSGDWRGAARRLHADVSGGTSADNRGILRPDESLAAVLAACSDLLESP